MQLKTGFRRFYEFVVVVVEATTTAGATGSKKDRLSKTTRRTATTVMAKVTAGSTVVVAVATRIFSIISSGAEGFGTKTDTVFGERVSFLDKSWCSS